MQEQKTMLSWTHATSRPYTDSLAVLLIMLTCTGLVLYQVDRGVDTAAQLNFQSYVEKTHEAVKSRMRAYEQVLRGGVGLFQASQEVSRQEWHVYVTALKMEENFPGIQGVGFSKRIHSAELDRHIRQVRAEGFPEYTVKPPGERPEYTSILYLEPFNARNQRAFGYDMFSEPVRHAAMAAARDSGKATISGKVVLKQETSTDVQFGFLMYLPLYAKEVALDTPAQREQALLGYVYSPFRMNDLMRGILGGEGEAANIDLEIYDGEGVSDKVLMYDSDGVMHGKNADGHRLFSDVQKIEMQGRTWTLAVTSTPTFEARIDHSKPLIVAIAGVIISLLFSAVVWTLATHRTRAQMLAKRMVDALQRQEALTQAIVDDAADGIITISERGTMLSFNHAAERMFGYEAREAMGRNVNMLMPEPYHSAHDGYITNYLATGEKKIIGIGREVSGIRRNGEVFPMELSVSEVRITNGSHLFAGIVRDITERKRVGEALRRSEERFDLAIRGSNDGLWDWDMNANRVYFSPRWKSMLGYAEDEMGEALDEWRKRIFPDEVDRVMAGLRAYLDGRTEHYQSEHRMRHKDGHYVWVLDRGIAQRDAEGKPYRMVGIHTDISKQKQMENLKSEFVSTVSHELRTPLTSIRGSLGLVAGGVTGELSVQARELIDVAYKNTERLLALINDILDIEKIQSGKMDYHFKPQALMPLIEQVIASNAGYAEQYNITYQLTAGLHGVMVNVDGERLMQVMSNLLSNAAKFSHAGGRVEVAVTVDKQRVRVAVTDHGVGIPDEFRERIFDKFTQADSSDTRHKGGTGLGLSISKAIIEMMHGELGFDSRIGVGTTFYCILPEWRGVEQV